MSRIMKAPANHLFEHTPDSLRDWCGEQGMPPFRAAQILEWVYRRGVIDPAQMTNLAARDRARLAEHLAFLSSRIVRSQWASDGTRKLLLQWESAAQPTAPDHGNPPSPVDEPPPALRLALLGEAADLDPRRQTECVMIPATSKQQRAGGTVSSRRTACLSSQVGCPVGCRFCASGLGGLDGNLSAGRIIEQAWRLSWLPQGERLTHVVFMGMGEPLANFSNVVHAIRTLAAPWGLGLSARRITISTVGLHKAIERLADELELPVNLALSLHAPDDELRRSLIPWAQFTTIDQLLAACARWFERTGREITLEYTLLRGVNDSPEQAQRLADLAHSLRATVNLIRFNEVRGVPFSRPRTEDVRRFQEVLRARRVNARIRASRGRDIAAACGQLRHESAGAGA